MAERVGRANGRPSELDDFQHNSVNSVVGVLHCVSEALPASVYFKTKGGGGINRMFSPNNTTDSYNMVALVLYRHERVCSVVSKRQWQEVAKSPWLPSASLRSMDATTWNDFGTT
jgi:hypothetical protein